MKINNVEDARLFLRQVVKGCPRIKEPDNFLGHVEQLSKVLVDTVKEIKKKIPEFNVDEKEIELAGILHDIGHCFSEIDEHHPVIGGEYLEEFEMKRIAKIIRSHVVIKEILEIVPYKNYKSENLMPKTWNEVLITYASMVCGRPGENIDIDEKFRRFKNKSELFQKAVVKAKERIYEMYNDIKELKKGNKKNINKYGFL